MKTDEISLQNQELLVDVDRTLKDLLEREDIDGNQQITIDDQGPKVRLCVYMFLLCIFLHLSSTLPLEHSLLQVIAQLTFEATT